MAKLLKHVEGKQKDLDHQERRAADCAIDQQKVDRAGVDQQTFAGHPDALAASDNDRAWTDMPPARTEDPSNESDQNHIQMGGSQSWEKSQQPSRDWRQTLKNLERLDRGIHQWMAKQVIEGLLRLLYDRRVNQKSDNSEASQPLDTPIPKIDKDRYDHN